MAAAGVARPPVPLLRAFNLVFARPPAVPHAVGAACNGRFLFLVPWRDRTLAGTAYVAPDADAAGAVAAFLDDVRAAYPWAGLQPEQVAVVHDGWVPGRDDGAGLVSRSLLIDHEEQDGVAGLVSMVGVKYTTARGLAERAVDVVVRRLGRGARACRTATTALVGTRVPDGSLAEQVRHTVREEAARHLTDVVLRRLDLGTGGAPGPALIEAVEQALAAELGWDAARRTAETAALSAAYATAGRAGHGSRSVAPC